MKIIKMSSGDEQDALTKAKNILYWKPGQRKRIKRLHNRKIRRLMSAETRKEITIGV